LAILLAYLMDRQRPVQEDFWEAFEPVSDFQLTNQHGQPFGMRELRGKVWIADIIFTRCPGPCATMSRRMRELQDTLPADWPVALVSLTTDPDYDTPPVLADYARRFGAEPGRWVFLTGAKDEIRRLAVDGLRLAAMEKPAEDREAPNDLWIHSTLFVVVDKQGRLRGVFESMPRADREEPGEPVDADAWFGGIKLKLMERVKALVESEAR
jgi:protein SCO1/2